MKTLAKIFLITLCFLAFSVKAQTKEMSPKAIEQSNIKFEHDNLINMSVPEVMKTLNLSAQDTIGKTGTMQLQLGGSPLRYFSLALKDGTTLGFRNNQVAVIIPKK